MNYENSKLCCTCMDSFPKKEMMEIDIPNTDDYKYYQCKKCNKEIVQ